MDYIDLINGIDNKTIKNINLIHVKEIYFLDLALNSLKSDFLGEDFLDFNYQKINFGEIDFEKYQELVETLPFMSDKKVVVIENCDFDKNNIKKYETLLEEVQSTFEKFNPMTYLFFIYRGDTLFKGKFIKSLEKFGSIYEFNRLDDRRFAGFISKYFAKKKIKLDERSARFLSDRLRYLDKDSKRNLFEIENELDKLANNIKSKSPSFDEIEASIIDTFEEKIFGLLDYMSSKNVKKSIEAYKSMKHEDEFMIYYMILRQVKNMISIKSLEQNKIFGQTALNYSGLKSFEYNKVQRFVVKYKMEDLLKLHSLCYESEKMIKTSKKKIEDIVERIIIQFCLN